MSENSCKELTAVERYYRFHSKIYDYTRWSFLFGRTGIISKLSQECQPARILEVGCGTGRNLRLLCNHFPNASVTGLDLSEAMLETATCSLGPLCEQVDMVQQPYDTPLTNGEFDLILFSYALTMFNPGWETAIECARKDLKPGGIIGVVDFHNSPFCLFRSWMGVNHVRMDGHLAPKLQSEFMTRSLDVKQAYGGVWSYLTFIGEKPQ